MAEPREKSNPVASPLPMLPRIVEVEAAPESHTIIATFASGEKRRFDVAPLLDRGVFKRIRAADAFVSVEVDEMGGVVWDAGPDLSRDTIYLAGDPV